jgi:DNA-binding beta-propeller fold protein YncE
MDNCRLRIVIITGVLLHVLAGYCAAGDAAFSQDGEQIYAIASTGADPVVQEIDLATKTVRTIPLRQLGTDNWPRGITCSDGNKIFCTTEKSLWSFNPNSGSLTKIRDAPSGAAFWRIAFDPKIHGTFVTTDDRENPLFMFRKESEWVPVRMRRHPYSSCLAFTASGELFFGAYGDLWYGEIQTDTFDGEDHFSVAAYRYAPLATLETENSSPAEIGVADIGVSREAIYVQLSRMGGSGDGWFARLARPVPKRTDEQFLDLLYKPNERLPVYQKSLSSLKILGEDSRAGQIAVSPDERRVYYVMQDKHWLVTNGKTEELHLTKK